MCNDRRTGWPVWKTVQWTRPCNYKSSVCVQNHNINLHFAHLPCYHKCTFRQTWQQKSRAEPRIEHQETSGKRRPAYQFAFARTGMLLRCQSKNKRIEPLANATCDHEIRSLHCDPWNDVSFCVCVCDCKCDCDWSWVFWWLTICVDGVLNDMSRAKD